MPDDFHRAQVGSAPEEAEMVDAQTVDAVEMPATQAAHGTAGDGRLRATKFNSALFLLLLR